MTELTDRTNTLSEAQRELLEQMSAPAGERTGLFPPTAAQRSLWFADRLDPGASTYHMPVLLRLRGELDADLLGRAVQRLVDEHEALRTTLVAVDGSPLQYVRATREHRLTILDATGRAVPDVVAEATERAHTPFDLAAGPLLRVALWRLGAEDHLLLIVLHHSMADGWSLGVLLNDLAASLAVGAQVEPVPPVGLQPVDLALREVASGPDESAATFWIDQLAGATPPQLPSREDDQSGPACGLVRVPLADGLPARLHDLARRHGTTDFAVHFAALAATCHRMSYQRDLLLGASLARRSGPGTERTVGLLVNALPIRLRWSEATSFDDLVTVASSALRSAMAHGDVPLDRIVQDSAGLRPGGRTPFLDVVFSMVSDPLAGVALGGCAVERLPVPARTAKFPLLVSVESDGRGTSIACEYDRTLIDDEFVGSLARALGSVLEHVARDPSADIEDLPLLDAEERRACLERAAGPAADDILGGRGCGAVVADIARRHPDRIALVEGDRRVTYGELLARADSLALTLRRRGAGPDRPVGVALSRGIDQITACLGIVRAGGHYLPLDPGVPPARNRYMLEQAGARLLVTGRESIDLPAVETLSLDPQAVLVPQAATASVADLPPGRADDLLLVSFTSGSTGKPKGYGITHQGIALLVGDRRYLTTDLERVFLIANTVTFDASTWEIWSTLLTGSTGVIVGPYGYSARALGALIREHSATTIHVTTQLFNTIVDEDPYTFLPLSELIIGGEAMSADHVRRAARCLPGTRLLNAYGPAECAVMSTIAELGSLPYAARRVPIGVPVAETQVYVLDERLRVVPVGVAGEIYVGGPRVGRGYAGRPDLTAERFLPSPFAAGERVYRTGDIARVRGGGALIYLGRADHQVKIRGYRVEPGEIEASLVRHPAVAEAVVTPSPTGTLVAYVIPNGLAPGSSQLRDFLRADLPEYMIPSTVLTLDRFPLTPNGKIDRAALPAPGLTVGQARYVAPRTDLERTVVDVWSAVLNRAADTLSINEDFFEAGGHSLLATKVVARLEHRLGRTVPLRLMFEQPTAAGLARAIEATEQVRTGGAALVHLPGRQRAPLSSAQQRLWFLHEMEPESALYNLPLAVRLTGIADLDLLDRALQIVVDRHETLRTVFVAAGDDPTYAQVSPARDIQLSVVHLPGPAGARRDLADRVIHQVALAPFDLARDLPIRANIVVLGPAEQVLVVTVHHIACDGWSAEILAREVSAAYTALRAGVPCELAQLPVQYGDFAAWQQDRLSQDVLRTQLDHWERTLAGAPTVVELAADHPRPAVFRYRGASQPLDLDEERTAGVRQVAAENRVTPFMVLIAGLAVMVHRYTGLDDILIGTPVAGRSHPAAEDLIGFFANTLVLRVDLSGDPSAWLLLERVHAACLDAYGHQELPFEQLVEHLRPERDISRTPLFQVMLAAQGEPLTGVRLPGLDVTPYPVDNPSARCDLTVLMREGATKMTGVLEYNRDLFEPETAARMASHLTRAIEWLSFSDGSRLSEADLLSTQERTWLQQVGRGPVIVAPGAAPPLVPDLIMEWAVRHADGIAATGAEPSTMTYRELMDRARGIAAALAAAGVVRGEVVGVLLPRSPEIAAALIGVWLAGAAFVPLDSGYPLDRLSYMAEDAGITVVLTCGAYAGRRLSPRELLIETLPPARDFKPVALDRSDTAYLLYTSGSTGRPKGVVVNHGGLAALVRGIAARPGLSSSDRLVAVTTFSFDMGVLELFGPLAAGGTVVIASEEQAHDPYLLAELIEDAQASVMQATPATWRMLVASGWRSSRPLRVWCGGEAMPADLAEALLAAGHELWNGYGPTETTVYSAVAHITDPTDITIGHPVAGTEIQLLDPALRLVPAGTVGEICVGGAGVADGYRGRGGLTAERFVPGADGTRLYRTGDLGRWDRHGRLAYLGRTDRQIKLRGMRIEPGEIEARLARHTDVRDCVVIARGDELVAYVVAAGSPVNAKRIREFLRTDLPEYMVPSVIVPLDALPLTPNGKLDRAALPDPAYSPEPPADRVAPRDPTEQTVAEVWATVLARPAATISVFDDFFELGGHSLLAGRVAGHLSVAWGRRVSVRLLFEHPTVAALAAALRGDERAAASHTEGGLAEGDHHDGFAPVDDGPALRRADDRDRLPLSFAQERLWFLHRLDPGAALYNVPLAVRLAGELDVDLLYRALEFVVAEHEGLRTVFAEHDGRSYQRILPPEVAVDVVDLEGAGTDLLTLVLRQAGYAPFDLTSGRPFRATLARLGAGEHVLLLTVHHVACDGWSTGLLAEQLSKAYSVLHAGGQPQPARLPVQYGDFAAWQRERLSGEVLAAELRHWQGVLAGSPATLDLPTDRPRPAVFRYRGAGLPLELSASATAGIRRLAADHQMSPFMVLTAALSVVLSRYAGQDDVVIGTPVAGREHPLLEQLIGFFTNTLVLRVDLAGVPDVTELLRRVRSVCLDAYGHQELPFERLVEHLQPQRDLSRTPIFQVMLALQNDPVPEITLPGLRATLHHIGNPTAKYDLVFTLRDNVHSIGGVLEYNSDLFEPESVLAIRDALVSVLDAMASGPHRVADLPMCESAERQRLLSGWDRTPEYDPSVCLHDLVGRQIAATPEAIAVIGDEPAEVLTYAELDRRANRIARLLGELGVGVDQLVAVLLPRSADMVVALLGVLRCGAAFLPLDPEHPAERLSAIVDDAEVAAVVTTEALAGLIPDGPHVWVSPEIYDGDGPASDISSAPSTPGGLAYAVYTSGSTGKPKGVLIEHAAICNNLLWMQHDWPLDGHDRVLQKTTIAFDVAVKEVFWPLLSGAAVVLARPGGQRDPEYIIDLLNRARITVAHFVPSMLEAALSYAERTGRAFGAHLEKVMAGAETLPAATLERFFEATQAELLHMYGPTETAIAVTGWTCPRGHIPVRVPLGRPMPGVQLYVLDRRMRPVPRGAWGELHAGGLCVGRGYLGRRSETAAAFVPDPFSATRGGRLYRTGDIVRINHEGLLEFRGRGDHQVKVRGFRIELGDVEAALNRHPDVRQAAVVAWPSRDGTTHRLVGYLGTGDGHPDEQGIRDHVRASLPDYMVPASLIFMGELPLNASGKIDRGRLPEPGPAPASRAGRGTPLERTVAEVVADVLELAEIGLDDDLFTMGGHSLQVPRIAALLAEKTGTEVPLREIFLAPTAAGIARAVECTRTPQRPAITRANRTPRPRTGGAP